MASTYLDAILSSHRARAAADDRDWRTRRVNATGPSLEHSIREHRQRGNAVIAEIKRKSPSKGWLAEHLDVAAQAALYERAGASAISVLTDVPHFAGSVQDLQTARSASRLPILRKDFTVSLNDVLDTAEMGASAVLLIVAALSDEELREFSKVARDIGLDALVEVHDEGEAERALEAGASMIGVNQRDLHSFAVDRERAERVAGSLPSRVVALAESGFSSVEAVASAALAGFDAVLVGESFVTSPSALETVSSYVGHPIGGRA